MIIENPKEIINDILKPTTHVYYEIMYNILKLFYSLDSLIELILNPIDRLKPLKYCVRVLFFLFFFFLINLFIIYLFFLAALGLCCSAQTFSNCSERGLLFVEVHGPLIAVASLCCGARALGMWASVVVARGLSSCGAWA